MKARIIRWLMPICAIPVSACLRAGPPSGTQPPLRMFLDAHGAMHLPAGFSGGIDPTGFRVVTGPEGGPRFLPAEEALRDTRWVEGFHAGHGCDDYVFAMAVDDDGSVYMGGHFVACGDEVFNHVVRYDPGTDTWHALGSGGGRGVNGPVNALLLVDGMLDVGGEFDQANVGDPVSARNIARWDGQAWAPVGDGLGNRPGDRVEALAEFDGDLVAAGLFAETGGAAPVRVNSIARWSGGDWLPLGRHGGAGVNAMVADLAVHDDALYAGGPFWAANVGADVPARCLARWDGSDWSAPAGRLGASCVLVNALALFDGELYVGGRFELGVPGGLATNIVRLGPSGWLPLGPAGGGIDGIVMALVPDGDSLLVAGAFDHVPGGGSAPGPRTAVDGLARWDGQRWHAVEYLPEGQHASVHVLQPVDGGIIASVVPRPGSASQLMRLADSGASLLGRNDGQGVTGAVAAVAVDGEILYLAGSFTLGDPAVPSVVAKWDGTRWHYLLPATRVPLQSLADISALAWYDGALYLGGRFTSIDGRKVNGLARWDGAGWREVGGGVEGNFGAGQVMALLPASDGRLYVGGAFSRAGGLPADGVAVWDGGAWSVPGGGALATTRTSQVRTLAEFQGRLLVGGTLQGKHFKGARSLAAWDGTQWVADPRLDIDGQVNALVVHAGGLYAGGRFEQAGRSERVAARNLARWDGHAWQAPDGGVDGEVTALASSGSDLYVAGAFLSAGGAQRVASPGIARWDGSAWQGMGAGLAPRLEFAGGMVVSNVNALAAGDSLLFVGGSFRLADGRPSSNIAAYLLDDGLFSDGFEGGTAPHGDLHGRRLRAYRVAMEASSVIN